MAVNDDDDGGSYVTIGKPLPIPEKDERRKKAWKTEDEIAVDEKGRRRFHGAFTGGFSAGYFNTVGTKEGWSPSTFVSSRKNRAESSQSRAPEDFMDDEDKSEFGIAPRSVKTASDYHDENKDVDRNKQAIYKAVNRNELQSAIPGGVPLEGLVIPSKLSVGVKMLRSMGWKEGQGIGEKVKKTKPTHVHESNNKNEVDDDDESIDIYLLGKLLAPKDVQPIDFTPKTNQQGIGYKGLNSSLGLFQTSLDQNTSFKPSHTTKKGIRGTAFGVGAFEEDDDDIYGTDDMSRYDISITKEQDRNQHDGWTGPPTQNINKGVLLGFVRGTLNSKIAKKSHPPPRLPRFFDPNRFNSKENEIQNRNSFENSSINANDRAEMIGESKAQSTSKFSLISKSEKGNSSITTYVKRPHNPYQETPLVDAVARAKQAAKKSRFDQLPEKSNEPNLITVTEKPDPVVNDNAGFKPFNTNTVKQQRYENYLLQKRNGEDVNVVFDSSMTEWEKEREMDEFARASILYRPMSTTMASRFTSASFAPASIEEDMHRPKSPSDKNNSGEDAAKLKMYGPMTRVSLEWHPDRLLCKRFNVPNPYPNSTFTGVPGRQKMHIPGFSLFSNSNRKSIEIHNSDASKENAETLAEKQARLKYQKSLPGPLSHLNNDSIPIKSKSTVELTDDQQNEMEENIDLTNSKENEERPPIDLFKAIFEGSDNEENDESSSDDATDDQSIVTSTNIDIQTDQGVLSHLNRTIVRSQGETSNRHNQSDTRSHSVDGPIDLYGPALPPSIHSSTKPKTGVERDNVDCTESNRTVNNNNKRDTYHTEENHHSRKKKSKKKKEKKSKKSKVESKHKRHKKKVKRKSSESESEIDDNELIERLKRAKRSHSSSR